ncbi:MAG: ribonuclease Z [Candidatus Peregrinibacteria bacterium]|nr:ribonuclease Z [Candidatus Peregrinibacteria bacterium]
MKLTILGSGTGIIRKERSAAAFLLEVEGRLLLFDCGWGAGLKIIEAGYDIQELDHILISHPHSDHMGNLMSILQSILVSGFYYPETKRSKPLHLHGYPGFTKDYEKLRSIHFPERHEPYEVHHYDHHTSDQFFGALNISSREVEHVPYFKAVSYRVDHKEKSFVYSGDCGYDKALIELAGNADFALLEMSIDPKMYAEQGPRPNHISGYEAGLIASKAGVKKLGLFHLYDKATDEEIEAEVSKEFQGKLIITQDLQVIKV